jgi:hypothetical protein
MKNDNPSLSANQSGTGGKHVGETEKSSSVIPTGESQSSDFEAWTEQPLPESAKTKVARSSILKKDRIIQKSARRITPILPPEPQPEDQTMEVIPVMEGDTLVGLKIQCRCGATHEVHLEYSDEA